MIVIAIIALAANGIMFVSLLHELLATGRIDYEGEAARPHNVAGLLLWSGSSAGVAIYVLFDMLGMLQ